VPSWNLRDSHMADTLDALADHLSGVRGEKARIVVWAYNPHVGDGRCAAHCASAACTSLLGIT